MNYIECVRELAKGDDYQNIYILSKDMGSIKIFENCRDFTYIQNVFLRYLNFYYNLYSDIAMGEVGEIVLENNLYSDAYVMWKAVKDKEKYKDLMKDKPKGNSKEILEEKSLHTSTWIFKNAPMNKVK
jgi:hypothetical protein